MDNSLVTTSQNNSKTRFKRFLSIVWGLLYKRRYLFRSIGVALGTLMLSILMLFFMLRLIPGSSVDLFARTLVNQRNIPFEDARILAIQILGYDPDESAFVQFWNYLVKLFHGNLGQSLNDPNLTVNSVIPKFLPWTLFLSAVSLFISFFIGMFMGSKLAYQRNALKNSFRTAYIVISGAFPDFIFGLLMLIIFATKLKWFPTGQAYNPSYSTPGFNFKFFWDVLYHGFLPIATYVFISSSGWALSVKGSCVTVMGDDYIYAARARGIPDSLIQKRYLRKNAMLPLITSLAISFAATFGGSPLIENIFNYPGLGQLLANYIAAREYFMIVGILFFTSAIIILANMITDMLYSVIDPRIRRGT